MRVDTTGDGQPDAYMVYEPYQDQGNAAVLTGVWQDWDAYNGGNAKWWINTGAYGCGQATPCTWNTIVAANPAVTIEEGPNCGPGGVTPCPGSLGVNQGSFNSGIISNADALYVSVNGDKTTYDFELTPPPPPDGDNDGVPDSSDNWCPRRTRREYAAGDAATPTTTATVSGLSDGWTHRTTSGCRPPTTEQCKNGGWQAYGTTFKNQGDCVSYVASKGKNTPNG